MRWAFLLLAGCRQIFGISDPHPLAPDAPIDAIADAADDASCVDSDHDGVCDAVDDWPCGAKPIVPSTISEAQNGALTMLDVTAFSLGAGNNASSLIVTAPGTSVKAKFNYTWNDSGCATTCVDQIEIGFSPGDRAGCAFDNTVAKGIPVTGNAGFVLTAPTTPGAYRVLLAIGQNFSCTAGGATTWFFGTPPDADTAGYICVQ